MLNHDEKIDHRNLKRYGFSSIFIVWTPKFYIIFIKTLLRPINMCLLSYQTIAKNIYRHSMFFTTGFPKGGSAKTAQGVPDHMTKWRKHA